jgi:hypothetical protein
MHTVALDHLRRAVVASERYCNDQRAFGRTKGFVNSGGKAHELGDLVQLRERGFPWGIANRHAWFGQ